jgi:diguanylate cyclase (GGDEF)-like protein
LENMYSNAGKILVIDDDDLTLAILRKLLEADNFEVEACSSAPEALDHLAARPYDAILCDMWMSGMNGKDFYLKLKEDFPDYARKIIFVTGDIASETTWEFIDERQLPYVIKPISRPLLRQRVVDIVGERSVAPVQQVAKPNWDGINRRRHRRVKIETRVKIRRKKWEVGEPDIAAVTNASRGGLYFVSDREYRVGMELVVAYPYTGYDDVEQDGYVVRIEAMPGGKRGIALAMGEQAAYARAAYAGSSEDVRKHHIWTAADVTNEPVRATEVAGVRIPGDEDTTRRSAEEIAELRRTHEIMVDKRDRLEKEAAALKAQLESKQREIEEQARELSEKRRVKEEAAEAEFRATHDALTGIWNRGAIMDMLRRELVRADREGMVVGVLLADLDHFKSVNDTYGHLAGDEVLREASRRIGAAVRSYDAVGRYGGEEFLILLAGCEDSSDMLKQAERIRTSVAAGPVNTEEAIIPVTCSMGVASSGELGEVEQLLRAADAALYRAKRSGRNRVEMAQPSEVTSQQNS